MEEEEEGRERERERENEKGGKEGRKEKKERKKERKRKKITKCFGLVRNKISLFGFFVLLLKPFLKFTPVTGKL